MSPSSAYKKSVTCFRELLALVPLSVPVHEKIQVCPRHSTTHSFPSNSYRYQMLAFTVNAPESFPWLLVAADNITARTTDSRDMTLPSVPQYPGVDARCACAKGNFNSKSCYTFSSNELDLKAWLCFSFVAWNCLHWLRVLFGRGKP